MPDKTYLDDQGNPIGSAPSASGRSYLDESGNPVQAQSVGSESTDVQTEQPRSFGQIVRESTPLPDIGIGVGKRINNYWANLAKLIPSLAPYMPDERPPSNTTQEMAGTGTDILAQLGIAGVSGGASLPSQVATQAALTGGLSAMQTGTMEGTATGAALGGAFPLVSRLAAPVVEWVSKSVPRVINDVIKSSKRSFDFGVDPGKAIRAEGISGTSIHQLAHNINGKLSNIMGELKQALSSTGYQGHPVDIHGTISDTLDDLATRTIDKTGKRAIERAKSDILAAVPKTSSVVDALDVKRMIGNQTPRWSESESLSQYKNTAYQAAYRAVDTAIDTLAPAAAKLNQRASGLIAASKEIEERLLELSRKSPFPNHFTDIINPALGTRSAAFATKVLPTIADHSTAAMKILRSIGIPIANAMNQGVDQ